MMEVKGAPARQESAGIKEVPKLKHHERGEEKTLVVGIDMAVTLEIPEKSGHHDKEKSSHPDDEVPHRRRDDELAAVARTLMHHAGSRRQ